MKTPTSAFVRQNLEKEHFNGDGFHTGLFYTFTNDIFKQPNTY